jgi:hypothetical protein
MSKFLTDLFESIFTPGPTHSLLVATNVAFAGLQLTLLALLIATYSVHFLILSFLSAGLWWAINWFVVELRIAEAAEAEKKKRRDDLGSGDDSETEAETVIETADTKSGSKEVEVVEPVGDLKPRFASHGSRSELSTEDEWERVSENEKDK